MLASAIIMLGCVIAYRILFENKVNPTTNRLILLSIYAITFIMPLLASTIPQPQNASLIELGQPDFAGFVRDGGVQSNKTILVLPYLLHWISRIYFIGLFITFLFSLLTILHLVFLLRNSKKMQIDEVEVYVHGNKKLSSFSWGNKIFIYKESLSSGLMNLKMLVSHEKAHLEKGHWIDLALAQIVLVFQWFNPASWFMRKELQRIHEYEADKTVLQSGINERDYQMLLIQNISGSRYSGLTDGLNNCSLKKRIIMMQKTKFKKDWVARGIAVCGFAILGGFIIHIPVVATILKDTPKSAEKSENVIVIKGETENNANVKPDYFIDGTKVEKENLASVNPSNIKEMTINKSSDNPKVEITTKKAPDLEDIDKIDFNEYKKKGLVENYPDAYGAFDKMAEYKGGQSQLLKDLSETIVYPEEAKKNKIEGKVVIRFQINTNGTLSNCEVAYSQNPILNNAALTAVEKLPGKWEPAEVDGKPVASVFNMPVTFKLQ